MSNLNLTLMMDNGAITTTSVSTTDTISSLNSLVTTSFNIPTPQQRFLYNNQPLQLTASFSSVGITDGDLILVQRLNSQPPSQPSPSTIPQQQAGQLSPDEQALMQRILNDPTTMSALQNNLPDLHSGIQRGDPSAVRQLLNYLRSSINGGSGGAGLMMGGPGGPGGAGSPGSGSGMNMQTPQGLDPMSVEGQKIIEERIRQENVSENMHAALEHNPESFGRVVMLFVDCKINALEGVKAFVDSGAQTTIISKTCAERCGLLNLLDTRFEGIARGVGTAKILGRIHLALMTLGTEVFEITFTVMNSVGSGYDILLGLDMLRKHNAIIDLSKNCLRIGDAAVPFLDEKDIPIAMREEVSSSTTDQQQQTVGTEQPYSSQAKPSSSNEQPSATTPQQPQPTEPQQLVTTGGASSSGAGNSASSKDMEQIVELGFSKEEAENALKMCDGDKEQAIAALVSAKFDS